MKIVVSLKYQNNNRAGGNSYNTAKIKMKTLNIITKKVNAGRFEIVVMVDFEETQRFETNDMSLVDDIQEWKNEGLESELTKFESFEELENYFLN